MFAASHSVTSKARDEAAPAVLRCRRREAAAPPCAVSVIVPTLDEAENIDILLDAVLACAREAALRVEIIVVDDGSTDGTRERVRVWERRNPVRLVAREPRNGLAGAVMAGAEAARGGILVVMDADLSHPPEKIPELVAPLIAGTHDVTIGSRHVPGGGSPGWPLLRRLASRCAAAPAALFTDAKDPMSGFFALRRDTMCALGGRAAGFKILLEILARGGESLRVAEVPITFVDRTRGRSKLGAGVMGAYLRQIGALGGGLAAGPALAQLGIGIAAGAVADVAVFHLLTSTSSIAAGTALLAGSAASALTTFAALRRMWRGAEAPVRLTRPGTIGAFVAVACAAASLHGGVFATVAFSWGLPAWPSIVAAAVAGAFVMYSGCAFYAFAPTSAPDAARRRCVIAAAGLIVYLVSLRLLYSSGIELLPEEAYYWNYGRHLDLSYLDHPPMVAWLIRLGELVLGHSEFAVRSGAIACGLVAMGFAYALARDLLGTSAGLKAALLASVLPFFFASGFLMTPDAPLTACWAGMLFFLERALLRERAWAWLGAGACLGLGMISKYTVALAGAAALLFMIGDRRSRVWLRRPAPYLAAALAAVIFLPVLIWNYQHDWASFRFQGPARWGREAEFNLHLLLGYVLILITPVGLAACILGFRGFSGTAEGSGDVLDRRARRFALMLALVPLAVFAVSSCRNETKMNWTGPSWLAVLPLMAAAMRVRAGAAAPRAAAAFSRAWRGTIAGLVLFYGAGFHVLTYGIPAAPLPAHKLAMCWRDLAQRVEAIAGEVAAETGARPLVIGMDKYHTSSLLAFYNPTGEGARETAGVHLIGRNALMYGYWFPGELQTGKSILMVGARRAAFETPVVLNCAERLGPLREIAVFRVGRRVATYYARVAYGYRGEDARGHVTGRSTRTRADSRAECAATTPRGAPAPACPPG